MAATRPKTNADGSGTTAIPHGPFNPVISEAFTVAPEVVYSPIVPSFPTNRFDPDSAMPAMPSGFVNP
jgi:hypothetical protein